MVKANFKKVNEVKQKPLSVNKIDVFTEKKSNPF